MSRTRFSLLLLSSQWILNGANGKQNCLSHKRLEKDIGNKIIWKWKWTWKKVILSWLADRQFEIMAEKIAAASVARSRKYIYSSFELSTVKASARFRRFAMRMKLVIVLHACSVKSAFYYFRMAEEKKKPGESRIWCKITDVRWSCSHENCFRLD